MLAVFESDREPVTAFDHKIAVAYQRPIGELAGLVDEPGSLQSAGCCVDRARGSGSAGVGC